MLDGDDPRRGVDVLVVDARVDRLRGLGSRRGGLRAPAGRGAAAARRASARTTRAEQSISYAWLRMRNTQSSPPASGMIALGLLPVGVADLLERRVGRDAEDLERVDLEAEHGTRRVLPRARRGQSPGRAVNARPGACRPLDEPAAAGTDARATLRSSTPSSEPRSFWRKAGWVWMNSSLTVAIDRSSIRPRLIPIRTLDKQEHGLFAGDRLGRLEDAVGPADLVVQVLPPLGEQGLAGRPLVLEDLGHDVGEDLDQLGLALAQGLLVGDLVEVARSLAPLAVEAADGQVDLLEGAEDLVDLLGLDQPGQVEHHADADAGADVGRAGGQVAELRAEGVGELFLELVVELVDRVPDLGEPEAREHELDAEMVLLVDHDRDVFQRC